MLSRLRRFYARQSFHPGVGGLFLNPFYFARKGLHGQIAALSAAVAGSVLDVGCGTKPYRELFRVERYVGLEIDSEHARRHSLADVFYAGDRFPFADAEFDALVANQVLEHVFEPARFLAEAQRVLKPGGTLLLTVPFLWDEHEQPHDFARYTSFGLRHLVQSAGFRVVEQRKTMCGIRAAVQMLESYLYRSCIGGNRWVNALLVLLLFAPLNLLGEFGNLLLPEHPELYLDNVLLARKTADA
jgi:SAM-dependent methyltransferase